MQPFSKRTVMLTAVLLVVTLLLTAFAVLPGQAADPDGVAIYNAIPVPFPGNYPSVGFQATSTDEYGDHIQFAGSERGLKSVVLGMSSWSCGNDFTLVGGVWQPKVGNAPCTTDASTGTGYDHPITLNLYAVDRTSGVPQPGALLASKEQTFHIPYRPSGDAAHCTSGAYGLPWYSVADGLCYNGYAFSIEFDFAAQNVTLPNEIIFGVAYNTYTHGAAPLGVNGPYSSLNVGAHTLGAPSIGIDVEPNAQFQDSTWAGAYCDTATTLLDVL